MRAAGIIAEYNPFHKGHRYHLEETRALTGAEAVVAVMSGDFTQRGEPALWDKWSRARMTVDNGMDLVLELPFAFACNRAEAFASGGVEILDRLGCVSHLSFGSEAGAVEPLQGAAERLLSEDETFKESLRAALDEGLPYPRARVRALAESGGGEAAALLTEPNNILAVEYLKQLRRTGSKMEPVTVKRQGAAYHDLSLEGENAGALALRKKFAESGDFQSISSFLPPETAGVMKEIGSGGNITLNDLYPLMVYRILTAGEAELAEVLSAGEGLENKLKKAVGDPECRDMGSLIKAVKSKRYTEARIKRLLVQALMGLTKEAFAAITTEEIFYARVLAFSKNGARLLKEIRKSGCARLPVLTNINKELTGEEALWQLLKYDILASDLRNLQASGNLYARSDHIMQPYQKK